MYRSVKREWNMAIKLLLLTYQVKDTLYEIAFLYASESMWIFKSALKISTVILCLGSLCPRIYTKWLTNTRIYNKSSEARHVNFYIFNLQESYNFSIQYNIKKKLRFFYVLKFIEEYIILIFQKKNF